MIASCTSTADTTQHNSENVQVLSLGIMSHDIFSHLRVYVMCYATATDTIIDASKKVTGSLKRKKDNESAVLEY